MVVPKNENGAEAGAQTPREADMLNVRGAGASPLDDMKEAADAAGENVLTAVVPEMPRSALISG